MKKRLFGLLLKLMYRNLSKGEYGCSHCKESTNEILGRIERRERVVIAFNPDFNVVHGEEAHKRTASRVFLSYHISDVTMKYPK